ncbi:protein of unknown function (DUF397) [Actinosynnema pretiosum]|nr:protein of unknown function (DUF397) [Actinosynnema pretiosum]
MADLNSVTWRTSSASQGNGQCVAVALLGAGIALRDSKSPHAGTLVLPQYSATAFVAAIKAGRLDG